MLSYKKNPRCLWWNGSVLAGIIQPTVGRTHNHNACGLSPFSQRVYTVLMAQSRNGAKTRTKGELIDVEYAQVRIPVFEVIPLRHAEVGSTLEFDAFSRDGKLVASEGTELTEELIKRFHNFRVRKVIVNTMREQWIPADKVQSLSDNVEVLRKEEFTEAAEEILEDIQMADSTAQMRKTALYLRKQASRAGDEEGARYLDELIRRTDQIERQINVLTEKLKTVEDEEARQQIMDALEGKVRELKGAFMEISAPDSLLKETLDVVNEREEVRNSLADFVQKNPDLVNEKYEEQDPFSDQEVKINKHDFSQQFQTAIEHFNQGNSEKAIESLFDEIGGEEGRISDQMMRGLRSLKKQFASERQSVEQFKRLLSGEVEDLEVRKLLVDVLEGRKTVNRQELLELPIPRTFAKKTYKLLEDRMETCHRAWNLTEEVMDGELSENCSRSEFLDQVVQVTDPSKKEDEEHSRIGPTLPDGVLVDVFDQIAKKNVGRGLQDLERALERSDQFGVDVKAEVAMKHERIADLSEQQDTLLNRIEDEIEDPENRDQLKAWMDGDEPFDPDRLMGMEEDITLLEPIGDFVTKKNSQYREVWEILDTVCGGRLRGELRTIQEGIFAEKIDAAENELYANRHTTRDSSGATNVGSGKEVEQPKRDQQSILELVSEGDFYQISNKTGLDLSEVKAADQLLQEPADMSGDEKILLEPMVREIKTMFYERTSNEDSIRDVNKTISAELEAENRPFQWFQDPPAEAQYILTHELNTTMVSVLLGQYFDLDDSEMLDITAASLANDLGMIAIPSALWLKNQNLTSRAEKEVQKHPVKSNKIATDIFHGDGVIADLVQQHHERMDGSGYPGYTENDQQHPLAPLLAAADAYTAMIEPRPYRERVPPDRALISMLKSKGQYDRAVVKGLVNQIGIYPNGSVALLSDTRLVLIHSQNSDHPLKPNALALTDTDRNRLENPQPLDLSSSDSLSISKLVRF